MPDDTEKAEELLSQSKDQTRVKSEAPDTDDSDDARPLDEAIADAFAQLEADALSENITVRDDRLAALFEALDETGRLADIEAECIDHLGRDENPAGNKAALARYLLRVGLSDVAPETVEQAKSGYRIHLDNQADAF